MANYYTRTVRIYGTENTVPVGAICKSIESTALFENELIWNFNKAENRLDLKWNSKRGAGELGIDYSKYHVWEIKANEVNDIFFYNRTAKPIHLKKKNYFAFNSILIDSKNEYINNTFFKKLIPNFNCTEHINTEISIEGQYKSNCAYDIGEVTGPVNETIEKDLDEFLKPRGDFLMINEFESNFEKNEIFTELLKFVYLHWHADEYELHEGFNKIEFLWKGRVVNTIERSDNAHDMWIGKNSDWWDNCKMPAWIKFINERKTHDNNR